MLQQAGKTEGTCILSFSLVKHIYGNKENQSCHDLSFKPILHLKKLPGLSGNNG
jgi:hypothetical protein